jgi:hypothetical protein
VSDGAAWGCTRTSQAVLRARPVAGHPNCPGSPVRQRASSRSWRPPERPHAVDDVAVAEHRFLAVRGHIELPAHATMSDRVEPAARRARPSGEHRWGPAKRQGLRNPVVYAVTTGGVSQRRRLRSEDGDLTTCTSVMPSTRERRRFPSPPPGDGHIASTGRGKRSSSIPDRRLR